MTQSDFAPLDYETRISRIQNAEVENDLDAVLLTAGPNLVYYTGASGMLGGTSNSRPIIGLIPAEGNPSLLAHELDGEELRHVTSIEDIRTYDRLSHLPTPELGELLTDAGVSDGRIGVEFGIETRMDAPVGEFIEYVDGIFQGSVIDAADILWEQRLVKTDAEIQRIEAAIEITERAYEQTFEMVEDGVEEVEIATMMENSSRKMGASSPWVLLTSGMEAYDRISRNPTHRSVEDGDMVWIDSGCSVDGYWSDYSRAGVVGGPTREQREHQRAVHEVTMRGIDAIEPGITAADVANVVERALDTVIEDLDTRVRAIPSRRAGRVGHGLGLMATELPSLKEDDSTILREGMVLTMEPAIATDQGTYHVEENVVVTTDGARRLTPDNWKLYSC